MHQGPDVGLGERSLSRRGSWAEGPKIGDVRVDVQVGGLDVSQGLGSQVLADNFSELDVKADCIVSVISGLFVWKTYRERCCVIEEIE